jgi:hypothetical protein
MAALCRQEEISAGFFENLFRQHPEYPAGRWIFDDEKIPFFVDDGCIMILSPMRY